MDHCQITCLVKLPVLTRSHFFHDNKCTAMCKKNKKNTNKKKFNNKRTFSGQF